MTTRTLTLLGPALLWAGPALAAGGGGGDHHGIPWGPIGFHALNLVLLLGFLAFVLRNRIPEALRARKAAVAKDIQEAELARTAAQARFDELEARLAGFETELEAMRAEARQEAAREREAILAKAEAGARAVAESAERSIAAETRRAQAALRADAARLAVQVASQQIQASITEADDTRLTHDFLTALQADTAAGKGADHG